MNDIRVILLDLDPATKGAVVPTPGGNYIVVLNALYNEEQRRETYNHEVRHLLLGHYGDARPITEVEGEADDKQLLLDNIKEASQNGLPLVSAAPSVASTAPAPATLVRDWKEELHRLKRQSLTGMYY